MEDLSPYELIVADWVGGHAYGYRIEGVVEPDKGNDLEEPSLVWEREHASTLPTLTPALEPPLTALLRLVDDPRVYDSEPTRAEYVAKFATVYGPLELCEHALPYTHHPDCYPAHAEAVSAWIAWARVFYAAEADAPIPEAATLRLRLPTGFPAREVIDWLARGHGLQARSPREGRHHGLFERLAGVTPAFRKRGQELCPHCGMKPPRAKGAWYCGDCVGLRNTLKSRRDRARDKGARRILRSVLPDRKDAGYAEALRQIAEPRTVLGASLGEDPLLKRVRNFARDRYAALMRKRRR